MTKNNYTKYNQAISYLNSMVNIPNRITATKKRDFMLKRFKYFLKLVNFHESDVTSRRLQYIHVGGTSGKGSVGIMIQEILTSAGYKTGLYTSPFASTMIERIKCDDKLIAPEKYAEIIEQMKPKIKQAMIESPYGRPSWFEINTAAALIYFKQQKCDYVVLEVGCGGRLDATNFIKNPKAIVINNIGLDHTGILGDTIEKIAIEKAGIIKPGTICFTPSTNHKTALKVIKDKCQAVKAKLEIIKTPKETYKLLMPGSHQQHNAEIAKSVAEFLDIENKHIQAGLKRAKLPCRNEIMQKNPTVILDGAHNESKIKTTTEFIKNLTYQKLYIIIALTLEKKPQSIFKDLAPMADTIYSTRYTASSRECFSPEKLAAKISKIAPKANIEIDLEPLEALQKALKRANKNDLILVTGSFFMAGELRTHWRSEQDILKDRKI